MPIDFDFFSLYVVITSPSGLRVSPNDITVDSGEAANFAFMYKLGKRAATGFLVKWFDSAARNTESSPSGAPSSPTFHPRHREAYKPLLTTQRRSMRAI